MVCGWLKEADFSEIPKGPCRVLKLMRVIVISRLHVTQGVWGAHRTTRSVMSPGAPLTSDHPTDSQHCISDNQKGPVCTKKIQTASAVLVQVRTYIQSRMDRTNVTCGARSSSRLIGVPRLIEPTLPIPFRSSEQTSQDASTVRR